MPLKKAAYREDFDMSKCTECEHGAPGYEDTLYLHSNCHKGLPYFAGYFDGVLTLTCAVCDKVVAKIAVASRKNEE